MDYNDNDGCWPDQEGFESDGSVDNSVVGGLESASNSSDSNAGDNEDDERGAA